MYVFSSAPRTQTVTYQRDLPRRRRTFFGDSAIRRTPSWACRFRMGVET